MGDHSGDMFYAEDHLPRRQRPIPTSGTKMTANFLSFLMHSRASTGYSGMGVIIGRSGVGKSIAVQAFLDSQSARAHAARPGCVKIKVQHRSSARALAHTLLGALGERPYGHNVYELSDEVALAVLRTDLELLLIDEADRLNADSYEVLRHVFDRTGCPIVVVGLPQILEVITYQEKFASRISMQLDFPLLSADEIIDEYLPYVKVPRWCFDPTNPTDRALGASLWRRCKPSLRRLRSVLQSASQLAQYDGQKRVTAATVGNAFRWSPSTLGKEPQRGEADDLDDVVEADDAEGTLEASTEGEGNDVPVEEA